MPSIIPDKVDQQVSVESTIASPVEVYQHQESLLRDTNVNRHDSQEVSENTHAYHDNLPSLQDGHFQRTNEESVPFQASPPRPEQSNGRIRLSASITSPEVTISEPETFSHTRLDFTSLSSIAPVMEGYVSHTSPNDFSITSNCSMPPVSDDAAMGKWFDLLMGDTTIDLDQLTEPASTSPAVHREQPAADHQRLPGNDYGPQQLVQATSTSSHTYQWKLPKPLELHYHELRIFENFVFNIAPWIDLFDPFRHFAIVVPRLAMRNIGLVNALLALSCRHLSLNPHLADGITFNAGEAIEYYHASLRYLAKAMQSDAYTTSDELLATALLISAYEMLDGSRRDWERHLQGIFWIQRSQIIHGDSGGLRGAIWWAWLCQDCWAALKEKRKPFTFWRPERTSFKNMTSWELAARSIFIFKGVVAFCADKRSDDLANVYNTKSEQASGLGALLDEWYQCLPIDFEPLQTTIPAGMAFNTIAIHPSPFAIAMQIHYASRILLALHKPVIGSFASFIEQQNHLSECANKICGISRGINDPASSIMNAQCLYIAGTVTLDSTKREEIVSLIQACTARTGWPVRRLEDELRELWQQNGEKI